MRRTLLIVSAETSSCEYVESLYDHWQSKGVEVEAFGIGNRQMVARGFEAIVASENLGSFGLTGLFSKYKKLKAVFFELLKVVDERKPSCALLLDYSGFNLRLAKELRSRGIPVIYYVSPQVWAWDRGRTEKIKSFVDRMLCLFPFEVDYYKSHGVTAEFVGHPALEKLSDKYFVSEGRQTARARFGFRPEDQVVGFMPGSRISELDQHLPIMMEVARRLNKKHTSLKFAFLTSPNFEKSVLAERLGDLRLPYVILKDEPLEMIHVVDLLLVASGTASLMVGLLQKPMVIMYRASWLTGVIGKRFIQVPFICILNLIAGKEIVPERIQAEANPKILTDLMERILSDTLYREQMIAELKDLRSKLGQHEPTARVAEVLEEYFEKAAEAQVQ